MMKENGGSDDDGKEELNKIGTFEICPILLSSSTM
jgi:hypothetical protein